MLWLSFKGLRIVEEGIAKNKDKKRMLLFLCIWYNAIFLFLLEILVPVALANVLEAWSDTVLLRSVTDQIAVPSKPERPSF